MIIGMVPVTASTYGGYVNVSRQNIDWSQPAIMDLVINDLAAVYAQETEKALCVAVDAATTAGPTIPTGPATPAAVNAAVWAAAGAVYADTQGRRAGHHRLLARHARPARARRSRRSTRRTRSAPGSPAVGLRAGQRRLDLAACRSSCRPASTPGR